MSSRHARWRFLGWVSPPDFGFSPVLRSTRLRPKKTGRKSFYCLYRHYDDLGPIHMVRTGEPDRKYETLEAAIAAALTRLTP